MQTLKSLNDEILGLINEDEVTTDIEQADEYKERVYEAISRKERKLQLLRLHISSCNGNSGHSGCATACDHLQGQFAKDLLTTICW